MQRLIWLATGFTAGVGLSLISGLAILWVIENGISEPEPDEAPFFAE